MLIGQKLGSYNLEKELGSGAMGTVYRARHEKTGLRVAIKVLAAGLDQNPKANDRFEREIEVLKQLKHPNIVRYMGHGSFKGTKYVAMEFIDGETLDVAMQRRGGRFAWEEVVEMGKQMCAALQHAHHQGIIHRDLKPSNLMITRERVLKLADFGIAKDLDMTQLTSAYCTVGTAAYMSPEQCRGEKNLTHRSDLYSLGVLLYELLTGEKPFHAETAMEMFMQHTQGKFVRPGRLVPEIPVWLDNLVCQLLAKNPEERGFDAAVVGEALSRVVDKVSAQESAGVDVAKTRVGGMTLERVREKDVSDKQAARTLLTGIQGRRRRREKPVYEKTWFRAVALSGGLLALAVIFYFIFRPPSDDQLYAEAAELWKTGDADNRGRARIGPIEKYLARYPEPLDARGREIHDWANEIDREEMLRGWDNRIRLNINPEDKGEQAYRDALRAEAEGSLLLAGRQWTSLQQAVTDQPRETKIRQALAAGRLSDVQEALALEEKLKLLVPRAVTHSELERLAIQARQYEDFGDKTYAHDRWLVVKARADRGRAEGRAWNLLATKRARDLRPLPPEASKLRVKLVADLAKQVQDSSEAEPRKARVLLEDLRELYGEDGDPAIKELVKKASDILFKGTRTTP